MKPLFFAMAAVLAAALWHWRRKLEPTLLIGGAIVCVGLAVYGADVVELPKAETVLEDVGDALGRWTYLLVAIFAFLETGAFVGLLAPGETIMVFGGVVAGQGTIDLYALIAIVWIAAVLGDTTSFYLGRRLGRTFLERHGPKFQITESRLAHVEAFFARHGGKTILVGRFVGLVRAVAPFLAGSSGMRFKRFLPYDVIGAGAWATAFVVLGYVFWQSFSTIADYAAKGALALGSVIVVVVGIVVGVRWLRQDGNRRRARQWLDAQAQRPLLKPVAAVARPVWRASRGPLRFIVARLAPSDIGLQLITLLSVATVGSFAFITPILSLRDDAVPPADERALSTIADIHVDWLADVAKVVTQLGALRVVGVAVVLATLYVLRRRRYLEAIVLPVGMALTIAAVNITKPLEGRPRMAGSLVDTSGDSFPSGHAAYAIGWIAIAVVLTRTIPGLARSAAAITVAAVAATAIALSRVYLRAHYLTDVTGGAGLAALIFSICAMVALIVARLRQNGDTT